MLSRACRLTNARVLRIMLENVLLGNIYVESPARAANSALLFLLHPARSLFFMSSTAHRKSAVRQDEHFLNMLYMSRLQRGLMRKVASR